MQYSPLVIADFFIARAQSKRVDLDAMKLQKLVYIALGWHLAVCREPLFSEPVVATEYGPVIPVLDQCLRRYGPAPITGSVVGDTGAVAMEVVGEPEAELLERVWMAYGHLSGIQLCNLTHSKGTPWARTLQSPQEASWNADQSRPIIAMDLIEEHFRNLAYSRRVQ